MSKSIRPGTKFATFAELKENVHAFEKETHAVYSKTRATRLTSFLKAQPLHRLCKTIRAHPGIIATVIYRSITFTCKYGGFNPARPGPRKRLTTTLKTGCRAFFTVALKQDLHLHVTTVQFDHDGHELSAAQFNLLAINRRLPDESHAEILRMVARGVSKLTIRKEMEAKYHKLVTRDDLNNLLKKLNDRTKIDMASEEESSADSDHSMLFLDEEDIGYEVYIKEENGPEVLATPLSAKRPSQGILDAGSLADDGSAAPDPEMGKTGGSRVTLVTVEDPIGATAAATIPIGDEAGQVSFTMEEVDEPDAEMENEDGDGKRLHVTLQPEATKDYYFQKYKKEWEELPEFKDWLQPVADDLYKAECVVCNTFLRCHKLKLRQHAKSKKHHMNMVSGGRTTQQRRHQVSLTPRSERRSFGRRVGGSSRGRGRGVATRRTAADQDQEPHVLLTPQDVSYGDMGRVTYSIGLGGNKVGFIGAGTIAQAIAQAILDKGVIHSGRLTVSAPSSRHLSVWSSWGCAVTNCNDAVMQCCSVVFLCVPPGAALAALHALTPDPECGERCFVSAVPGLSRQRIESILASKFVPPCEPGEVQTLGSLYVVRCMVNLAVRTGAGCCAYSVPANLPDRWLLCLEVICGSMGVSQPLDDERLDAFAAAVSPGPAMALAFCEALTMGAASLGLPWHIARKMAAQTLVGTGQMMLDAENPSSLHDQTAPAGSSGLQALITLQRTDVKSGVAAAVQACQKAMRAAFGE